MLEYRWYNQDFGWTFDFSDANILHINPYEATIPTYSTLEYDSSHPNGKVLTRVCLELSLEKPKDVTGAEILTSTWDVDTPDEKDMIYFDGEMYRNLFGYPGMWFNDYWEDIPTVFFDDKKLDVFIDIDTEHDENYWAVQILLSWLWAKFTAEPSANKTFTIISYRDEILGTSYDTITQAPPTDENGKSVAYIETRDQHDHLTCGYAYGCYQTVIRVEEENIYFDLNETTYYNIGFKIPWFPAKYDNLFHVTCYNTILESDYNGKCLKSEHYKWCAGHTPPATCYFNDFMKDVKNRGSGKAIDGEIVQHNGLNGKNGCYFISDCPKTSSGFCAQAGRTIAVDKTVNPVIPFMSLVDIDNRGPKVAEDVGKEITGWKIDVYNGFGVSACSPSPWDGNYSVEILHY